MGTNFLVPTSGHQREKQSVLGLGVLVSLVELNLSFEKPHWNLYKVDTIGALQQCSLYGDVHFIESPAKNQKFSKVNMKSTICHDFPSPDLLEGPKDRNTKENAKFFPI